MHLLHFDINVESEKTAVIAFIAFPEFIRMATGGLTNLKSDVNQPLANKKVILLPDSGCYDQWSNKITDLPKYIYYYISELVEEKSSAEEKDEGSGTFLLMPVFFFKVLNDRRY